MAAREERDEAAAESTGSSESTDSNQSADSTQTTGPAGTTVRVNGEARRLPLDSSLLDLIEHMGLDRRFLVVEYNGEPLGRDAFEGIVLREGDRLEMVRPVAGG